MMGDIMRILRTVLIVVLALAVGGGVIAGILILGVPHSRSDNGNRAAPEDLPRFASEAPLVRASVPVGVGVAGLADPRWIASTSKATGIPQRALRAYAGVAIQVADAGTGCSIGWNTLAGIGEVESHHGTIFGGTLNAAGNATPAIFGVPLDGGSFAKVPDSDGGAIDGDPTIDRAVGPMQLIPNSWQNWHTDANLDGVEDPQNIDDATMAAAHYLCRAGGQQLGQEAGWRKAVLAYNGSGAYLTNVIRHATEYAKEAAS
ncbi:membrane-bound lytic murein transglycosylase B [Glaciihabitans sp. UYNi722]